MSDVGPRVRVRRRSSEMQSRKHFSSPQIDHHRHDDDDDDRWWSFVSGGDLVGVADADDCLPAGMFPFK